METMDTASHSSRNNKTEKNTTPSFVVIVLWICCNIHRRVKNKSKSVRNVSVWKFPTSPPAYIFIYACIFNNAICRNWNTQQQQQQEVKMKDRNNAKVIQKIFLPLNVIAKIYHHLKSLYSYTMSVCQQLVCTNGRFRSFDGCVAA